MNSKDSNKQTRKNRSRWGLDSITGESEKRTQRRHNFDFRQITLSMIEQHRPFPVSGDFRREFKKKIEKILGNLREIEELDFSQKSNGLVYKIIRDGIGGRLVLIQQLPGRLEFKLIISGTTIRADIEESSLVLTEQDKYDCLKYFREFLEAINRCPDKFCQNN